MSGELLANVTGLLEGYLAVLATVGTAIGVLTALALLITRRAGPRSRYAMSCIGLMCMVVVPSMAQLGWRTATPIIVQVRPQSGARELPTARLHTEVRPGTDTVTLQTAMLSSESTFLGYLGRAFPILAWLWVGGVAILLAKQLASTVFLQKMKRSTIEVPEEIRKLVDELKQRLGVQKRVSVRHGPKVPVPMVIGYWKPTIMIPTDELKRSQTGHLEAVLAHELAHVKRFDNPVGLLLTMCVSVLFFNPLASWLRHVSVMEREFACDDLAVQASRVSRTQYARALAELQLSVESPNVVSLSSSNVITRIERLASPNSVGRLRRRELSSLAWLLPVTVFITGLITLSDVAYSQGVATSRIPEGPSLLADYGAVLWITVLGHAEAAASGPSGFLPKPGSEVLIEEHYKGKSSRLGHIATDAEGLVSQALLGQPPFEVEVDTWAQSVLQHYVVADALQDLLTTQPAGINVITHAEDDLYVSILRLPRELTAQQAIAALNSLTRSYDARVNHQSSADIDPIPGSSGHHAWRLANLTMQMVAAEALSPVQQSQVLSRLGLRDLGQ